MKVTHIRIRKADGPLTVMDAFVDKGLTEGGHASLPDIDVDYASDRRQEIKDYLEERYNADGRQRVFSAGTFTTMKLKAALKDVARVHRVPHSIVNYITAMIDDGTDWTGLFRQAAFNRKLRDFIQTYPLVIEDVQGLLGQPKAASIHASAIVVTPDTRDGRPAECFDFLPVRKMDGALVSEFDGYSVDEIGLLKEDVLATKELAKLSAVIALVNRNFGQELTIGRITQDMLEDGKTYRLLSDGNTQNVFQFSSPGITRFIQAVQGISRPDTPVLLFCQHPFTSLLGSSNLRRLRYAWVWEKTQATGFLNARRMPMKAHEDILVFYDRLPKYHPIKTDGHKRKVVMAEHQRKCDAGEIYRKHDNFRDYISTERYPRSVLKFKTDKQLSCLHATQKPVALLEYLIRTYTDEGDIVLDFAMGSGSTAVACRNTGRRFIGVEIDLGIFQTALNRITHG